ncbi:MAG: sulfatase-like hydrolase/transferase [Bryobacteraceae bacterium]|nr:sulfatase-like hydrolase/transferase [Bryobacteraceae bacterium]
MNATRRSFLTATAGAALRLRAGAAEKPNPNVLFILADDLGWGDLSCYGNQRLKTPNLDRLAQQGTMFTQFYVDGPVCSPSRTAFLTGHFPGRHRVHGHFANAEENERRSMPNFLDPSVHTLPRLLKRAGYRTHQVGKWHMGNGPGAPMPDAYGFDEHKSVSSNETRWTEMSPGFRAQSTRLFVDETLRFIREAPDKPFYANLCTLLPHAPLDPTKEQLAPFMAQTPQTTTGHLGANQIYFASLRNLDDELGRLFRELDTMGLAGNTLVLFSSDNGPEDIHIRNASHSAFGSPGPFRGRKRSLYEGGVRLPLIARLPGVIPAGRVEDRAVITGVDFLPTILHMAGATVPADLRPDGEDVSDILAGASRARTKPIYWEWRFNIAGYNVNRSPMLSMRDGKWKLLMNPDRSRVELYDIPADPMELNNQAGSQAATVKAMSEKLLAWQKTLPPGMVEPSAGKNDYPWPKARQ